MEMESNAGPVTAPEGQPFPGSPPAEGTTQDGPSPETTGQPAAQAGTPAGTSPQEGTPGGTTESGGDTGSFFDPSDLPPELMEPYKQMQASYTRKMQALSKDRQKIEAYDAFSSDPYGQLQQMAQRYGLALSRPGDPPAGQPQSGSSEPRAGDGDIPPDWQPQSWGEVLQRLQSALLPQAEQQVRAKVMQELQPFMRTAHTQVVQNIERTFSELDQDAGLPAGSWREYESEMRSLLQEHPTLVNSPERLYRLALPDEVVKTQAMQRALKRLEDKTKSTRVDTKSSTSRTTPTTKEVKSFDDAVNAAREQLAAGR